MKLNLKNKKVLITLGVGLAIFISGNFLWKEINTNLNNMVNASSFIINMSYINNDRKTLLEKNVNDLKNKELQDEANKIISDLNSVSKFESKELSKDGKIYDKTKIINKTIDVYNDLNKDIDDFILTYEKNESLKDDKQISNYMEKIKENEYYIDKQISDFNKKYRVQYNKAVNSFPIKLIANLKGWSNINEFK